eukprot:100804-Rhodomonas_salina.2
MPQNRSDKQLFSTAAEAPETITWCAVWEKMGTPTQGCGRSTHSSHADENVDVGAPDLISTSCLLPRSAAVAILLSTDQVYR